MSEWGAAASGSVGGSDWAQAAKPASGGSEWAKALGPKPENPILHAIKAPLARVQAFGQYAASSPVAKGAAAVLGAPGNFVVGASNEMLRENSAGGPEHSSSVNPLSRQNPLGAGLYSVTHPGQVLDTEHELEGRVHLPVADPKTANPLQRVGQAVEDVGVGTLLGGPWSAPEGAAGKLSPIAQRLYGAPSKPLSAIAQKVVKSKPLDRALAFVNPGHDLRKIVTRQGENIVNAEKAQRKTTPEIAAAIHAPSTPKPNLGSDMRGVQGPRPNPNLQPGKTIADLEQHLGPDYHKSLANAFASVLRSPDSPLRKVSDIQRDALFALPFAHLKNLTILALLGAKNGVGVVAKGIGYARQLGRDPEALSSQTGELERMGGGVSYHDPAGGDALYSKSWLQDNPVAKKLGLGKMSAWSNKALETYDTGLRLALKDELAARGIHGPDAGGEIRDVMGGGDPSAMTQMLRGAGANFPGWGLGVVPRAMGKAVRDQPRAVQMYSRANQAFGGDVTQPLFGGDFDVGGPAEDASKLVEAPASFLASPSRLGPVADLFHGLAAYHRGGNALPAFAAQEAARAVPLSGIAESAFNFPIPSKAPEIARLAANVPGAYFVDSPTVQKRVAALKKLGFTPREMLDQLRREGAVPDPNEVARPQARELGP